MSVMFHVWNAVIYLSTAEPKSAMRDSDRGSGAERSRMEWNKNNKNKNKGKTRYHCTTPSTITSTIPEPLSSLTPTPEDSISEPPAVTTPTPLLPLAEKKGPFIYEPLHEVIDFYETRIHHESLAHYSTLHHQAPKTFKERWRVYEDMDSDEVYRAIYYQGHFFGWHLLTKWQEKFIEDYARVATAPCMFCKMPPNYWCDVVAKKL